MNVSGPLAGVRVLELATGVAGPYAGQILASLGADVIKVEEPATGDRTRQWGPFPADQPDPEQSGHFVALNLGKRGITLNLHEPEGRSLLLKLISSVDICLVDWSHAQLQDLKLDDAALSQAQPALVLVSVTPFGQTGPHRDWAGEEIVGWAAGGLMYMSGEADREPLLVAGRQAEHLAGLTAAVSSLAAYWQSALTGKGQSIDISVQECVAAHLEAAVSEWQYAGRLLGRMGTRHPSVHGVGMQRLADGNWLYVGTLPQPPMWEAVKQFMGSPAWANEPNMHSAAYRREHADRVDSLAAPHFASLTAEETYYPLQERKVPVAVVNDFAALFGARQLAARSFFDEVTLPGGQSMLFPGPPVRMHPPATMTGSAPSLGQHNQTVFREQLGLSEADMTAMRNRGVI